jgi:hypothetical protein
VLELWLVEVVVVGSPVVVEGSPVVVEGSPVVTAVVSVPVAVVGPLVAEAPPSPPDGANRSSVLGSVHATQASREDKQDSLIQ